MTGLSIPWAACSPGSLDDDLDTMSRPLLYLLGLAPIGLGELVPCAYVVFQKKLPRMRSRITEAVPSMSPISRPLLPLASLKLFFASSSCAR